jgi:hypothetical protein
MTSSVDCDNFFLINSANDFNLSRQPAIQECMILFSNFFENGGVDFFMK